MLLCFPIIAQHSKGTHYFHRVVGLVVIKICQWVYIHKNLQARATANTDLKNFWDSWTEGRSTAQEKPWL